MNTHASKKNVFQGLFDWDLLYKHFDPLCGLSYVVKCWTIATRFSQVAQRDSHDFCRFSLLDVPP